MQHSYIIVVCCKTHTKNTNYSVCQNAEFPTGIVGGKGYAVVQWLRHCATNRKVTGSIEIEIVH
jgi:hypothetical protein